MESTTVAPAASPLGLAGKHALVTGGTRGLGRAVVRLFAAAGMNVITCSRNGSEDAAALARELAGHGGEHHRPPADEAERSPRSSGRNQQVHVVRADVTRPADVDRLVGECETRFGTLDVLVNNVGVTSHVPVAQLPVAEWQRVLDTNLTATYLVTQRALPLLREGSSIVCVGTAAATRGIPLRAHYTAAKAGLIGLARSLCKELGPKGIRVNVVSPGILDTEEAAAMPPEHRQRYTSLIALGHLGRPEHVAGAVLFLASDLAAYVTGATLVADGGI